jgi:ABC-type multidrug transport system ATPase subunit
LDESIIPDTVSAFMDMLDMEYLADRLTGGYSGGNKRKLSLAIAI